MTLTYLLRHISVHFCLLALPLLFASTLNAQADRQLLAAGGGSVTVPGYHVSFSIGEPISGRREAGSAFLLQGFQQPETEAGVLPVTWLDFTAEAVEKNNLLNWHVALTGLESEFSVERGSDGFAFRIINILPIEDTGSSEAEFAWLDANFPPTLLYYRIRQTDRGGAETISPIRVIDRRGEEETGLLLYPNPAFGSVNWSLKGTAEDDDSELRLFDAAGRQVKTFGLQGSAGVLPVHDLPPGSYNFLCIPRSGAQNSDRITLHSRGLLIVR